METNFINTIKEFHNMEEYESNFRNIILAPSSAISEVRT